MIYAKGALAAAAAVGRVDDEAVRLRGDGSVVAVNRFVALAVGPLSAEARARVPLEEAALGVETARMEPGVVGEVAREVARDKRFGGLLEHTEWRCGEEGRVEVQGTDGVRRRTQVLKRLPDREDDSVAVLRAVYGVVGTGLVLNRKRLRAALDALDAAAPDTMARPRCGWRPRARECCCVRWTTARGSVSRLACRHTGGRRGSGWIAMSGSARGGGKSPL